MFVLFLNALRCCRLLPIKVGKMLKNFVMLTHILFVDWMDEDIDSNLFDAILLNVTRIGHGYAVTKHPVVKQLLETRQIPLEICPISNQVCYCCSFHVYFALGVWNIVMSLSLCECLSVSLLAHISQKLHFLCMLTVAVVDCPLVVLWCAVYFGLITCEWWRFYIISHIACQMWLCISKWWEHNSENHCIVFNEILLSNKDQQLLTMGCALRVKSGNHDCRVHLVNIFTMRHHAIV